jgi:hypothetical protein
MGDLSSELRLLRRGRGVMVSNLQTRIGPVLRGRAGISDSDGLTEARSRLTVYLNSLAEVLPLDLRLIFCVALALHQDTQFRFLEERMQWLSVKIDRDVRTVHRRFNEALDLLESAAEKTYQGEPVRTLAGRQEENGQIELLFRASVPAGAEVRVSFLVMDMRARRSQSTA